MSVERVCVICGRHQDHVRFYVVNGKSLCVFCTEDAAIQRVGNMLQEAISIREYSLGQLHALQEIVSQPNLAAFVSTARINKMVKELEDTMRGVGL
jgi:recombinational DNA repair protein (RecF pathway)